MNRKRIFYYILFDFLAALLVWLLFFLYRRATNDFVLFADKIQYFLVPSYSLSLSMIAFPIVALFFHYMTGYYNISVRRSRLAEFFSTIISCFLSSIVIFFVMLIDDIVVSYTFYYRSFLILWALFFIFTYLFRIIQTSIYISRLHKGLDVKKVLIVGVGKVASEITDIINKEAYSKGYRLAGYVRVNNALADNDKVILGNINNLEQIVEQNNIDVVIIAVDDMDNDLIFSVVNKVIHYDIDVCLVPRLFEIVIGKAMVADIKSEPFVSITRSVMPAWQQSVKRVFDVVVSCVALVLLSPLMLYLAVLIKKDSEGPILFKQERIGLHGKPFMIYKFRTMYCNAEKNGPLLSSVNDNRITKCGCFMRKYRLDEIPQFFNIIKGEMSIVGPRPERRYYINQIERIAPFYCLIYKVRPGLLSWGPIKIGYSDTIDKMVNRLNYDIIYMDNMSLYLDIKIILYSFEIILKGKGQ